MAHFAKLDENNIVIDVHVINDNCLDPTNEEASGIDFLTEWSGGHSNWAQTSYNTKAGVHTFGGIQFRKNYAGIGYTFDGVGFAPPKPYESWTLNTDTYCWEAPVPYPVDGLYRWIEADLAWEETTLPTE
jgi:hypothetical protein